MNNENKPNEAVQGDACTIEDWSFHWGKNESVEKGGGYLEIDGVLKPGFTGNVITILAYRVNPDGSRGAYYGHGSCVIRSIGTFKVFIEGPPPGNRISIRCGCE